MTEPSMVEKLARVATDTDDANEGAKELWRRIDVGRAVSGQAHYEKYMLWAWTTWLFGAYVEIDAIPPDEEQPSYWSLIVGLGPVSFALRRVWNEPREPRSD